MEDKLDAAAVIALKLCLNDESHDVRAMAAWALIKAGDKRAGQACLIQLLNRESCVTLKVLNIIDWMGIDTTPYLTAIKALKTSRLDTLVKNNTKFNPTGDAFARMQDYLLHPDKRPSVNRRGEIEKDEELLKKSERHPQDTNGIPYDEKIP